MCSPFTAVDPRIRAPSSSGAVCASRSSASRAPSALTMTWPMRSQSSAAAGCGSARRADRSASSTRCSAASRRSRCAETRPAAAPRHPGRHVHHARLRRRSVSDLQATVEHLKRTTPDVFLTTVSYPIKGTPYYDAVADRLVVAAVGRNDRSRSDDRRPAVATLLRLSPADG